jgi:hypothetical protein
LPIAKTVIKKQGSPRQPGGKNGNHWRADHHTERIRADDVSRHGDRHADIAGDIRQQPHDAELARTDAEATDGQCEFRQLHLAYRCRRGLGSRRGLARRGAGWFERNGRHEDIVNSRRGARALDGLIALQYRRSHLQN